jgi:hypothetical protein
VTELVLTVVAAATGAWLGHRLAYAGRQAETRNAARRVRQAEHRARLWETAAAFWQQRAVEDEALLAALGQQIIREEQG